MWYMWPFTTLSLTVRIYMRRFVTVAMCCGHVALMGTSRDAIAMLSLAIAHHYSDGVAKNDCAMLALLSNSCYCALI